MRISCPILVCSLLASSATMAAPVRYDVDPLHTHPSFEADHFGGVSVWRGRFDQTTGSIVLDREARTGSVDIAIDMNSVSTGVADLDKHLKSDAALLAADKFPTATFKGRFSKFTGSDPVEVQGDLTLHGVTRPVTLTLKSFKCMPHPMKKIEFCGADAHATINREEFGISWGKDFGFDMTVKLAIQVEAFLAK
jgi:polyisoprenoid-binding protein YceI